MNLEADTNWRRKPVALAVELVGIFLAGPNCVANRACAEGSDSGTLENCVLRSSGLPSAKSETALRELDDLYPHKHSIADNLYIKTADENYVVARWCCAYGLDTDFFWLAAHSLEKYMKAALLLNERSAKGYTEGGKNKLYSHDIEKLYADLRPLAPELLPDSLVCPNEINDPAWPVETTETFIKRIHIYGHPDNRYQFIGYVKHGTDVLKLDQVIFAIRRLCQPLEAHFLGRAGKDQPGVPNQTRRERMLQDDPHSRNLHSTLEQIVQGKRGKLLRRVLLNWNFPFAPGDFKHGRLQYHGFSMVNPVLVRRFLDPLDTGRPDQDKLADDLWSWAKENLHMTGAFINLYEQERTDRKNNQVTNAKVAEPGRER
ncbi:hypothetical protein ACRQ5Q_39425 [Bradyrhizobium sp. PMVTL-01]|uniref:hypothetical protein n=1 Tax=Bradyrhizobium sp. PMVTL-01 TaxID=3434999 RepID=UPI003F710AEB